MSTHWDEEETAVDESPGHHVSRPEPKFPQYEKLPEEIRYNIWDIALKQLEFVELTGFLESWDTPESVAQNLQSAKRMSIRNEYWSLAFAVSMKHREEELALSKVLFCHESASYAEEQLKRKPAWPGNGDEIFFCPNFLDLCSGSLINDLEMIAVHVPLRVENLAIYAEINYFSTEKLVNVLMQFRDLETLYLVLNLDEALYGEEVSKHTGFMKAPSLPPLQGHFDERELILKLYKKARHMRDRLAGILGKDIQIVQWERPDYQY